MFVLVLGSVNNFLGDDGFMCGLLEGKADSLCPLPIMTLYLSVESKLLMPMAFTIVSSAFLSIPSNSLPE
jgi:hypothetical protein